MDTQKEELKFALVTASEALDLLGHYTMDFTERDQDAGEMASMLRIISEYLKMKAE